MVVLPPQNRLILDGVNTENDQPRKNRNWPKDEFAKSEIISQGWFLWPVLLVLTASLISLAWHTYRKSDRYTAVVYCAQDQVYAEPIFREIEKREGIRIKAVYDSEAVKTVGLANRLIAERQRPQCDVYWGNEELRARQLAAAGIFVERPAWASFGYRSRRIVINTNLLSANTAPRSLIELTNATWRRRVALAYPLFGTTSTHFLALRQHWGTKDWENWCRALAANEPFLVDGNSVVVKLVGAGQAAVGLTDSDDILAGQREGLPVAALPMDAESLLIPNTVGLIHDAPHMARGLAVFKALQEKWVAERLVSAGALEGVTPGSLTNACLKVDWASLLEDTEPASKALQEIFLR
jgi:iron(III) transport system substrate-binding protein